MSPNTRRWFYLIAGLAAAAVPILMQLGVIQQDQGDAWVAALASVAGGGAALTAGAVTHRQIKQGLHDPPLNPVDTVLQAIPEVLAQQQQANDNVDRLRQATGDLLTGVTAGIPMVGDTVGKANDQVQAALDSILGTP